jgi:hypothetical protein
LKIRTVSLAFKFKFYILFYMEEHYIFVQFNWAVATAILITKIGHKEIQFGNANSYPNHPEGPS